MKKLFGDTLDGLDCLLRTLSWQSMAVLLSAIDLLLLYSDYYTGPKVPLTIFYLGLFYVALKYVGRRHAYTLALLTAVGKTYMKFLTHEDMTPLLIVWGFISRFSLYVMVCYLLDAQMTRRKEAETALDDLSKLNQSIVTEADSGVMVFRADGACILANEAAARIFGGPLEELRRINYRLSAPWNNFGLLKAAEEALATGVTQKINAPMHSPYGKDIWCMASVGRILRKEGSPYLLVVFADISAYKEIERRVIGISEETKRSVGQELHDNLGQHLTGIAFMSEVLSRRLQNQNHPEAAEAAKITGMVNEAISMTRNLAQGLYPVELEEAGLRAMLQQLAHNVETLYKTSCEILFEDGFEIGDSLAAINLFRISQEAVNNAIRHGKATKIIIRIAAKPGLTTLEISDNGCGMNDRREPAARRGLGMYTMQYRASLLGASLRILSRPAGGTSVTVSLPDRHGELHAA